LRYPGTGVLKVIALNQEDSDDLTQASENPPHEPHRHSCGSRCAHQVRARSLLDEAEDDLSGHPSQGVLGEVGARGRRGDAHVLGDVLHPLVEQLAGGRA
jgi:hypothetical protein